MIIKTKDFQAAASTILNAVDKNVTALELVTKDDILYLNVANREFYLSQKYQLAAPETFRAVVNAELFLDLITKITAETFSLTIEGNTLLLKVNKSRYKLALIYENDSLVSLPIITLENPFVKMSIKNDILKSIVDINSKELLKAKNAISISEIQKLYYITDEGCFTFTTGACLNTFHLDKPINLLLNDRIVKLLKLFKDDVSFEFGHDALFDGSLQTKVIFKTANLYLGAVIINDDRLLNQIKGVCDKTKLYIKDTYTNKVVISTSVLKEAISRIILFTKSSAEKPDSLKIPIKASFMDDNIILTDSWGNTEYITSIGEVFVHDTYDFILNIVDLKLVVESCKEDCITLNFGNKKSIVLTHGGIINLIPELGPDSFVSATI